MITHMKRYAFIITAVTMVIISVASSTFAWFDETHLAVGKAAGYKKWYNAAGADVAKVKAGKIESHNHYSNSLRGTVITSTMVLEQAKRYDTVDPKGHLYGAIIGSFRKYVKARKANDYPENHMAYLVHYIGDLSMPLHNSMYNSFNKKYHMANDGIIDKEVLENLNKIKLYNVKIRSEADLASEVARIANLSKALSRQLEREDRLMTKKEAYRQISHSASLLKGVLKYVRGIKRRR